MSGTATASGSAVKRVRCTCGHDYQYLLTREATGTFNGFTVGQEEADQKAEEDAAQRLAEMLSLSCDLCRCPQCGALTPEMEAKRKRDRDAFIPTCLAMIVLGPAAAGGVWWITVASGRLFLILALLGLLGLGAGLFGLLALCSGYKETYVEPLPEEAPPRPVELQAAEGDAPVNPASLGAPTPPPEP